MLNGSDVLSLSVFDHFWVRTEQKQLVFMEELKFRSHHVLLVSRLNVQSVCFSDHLKDFLSMLTPKKQKLKVYS